MSAEKYLLLNERIDINDTNPITPITNPIKNTITPITNTITNNKKNKTCWYKLTLKTPITGYDHKEHKMVLGTLVNKNRYEIRDLNLKAIPGESSIIHRDVEEIEWYGMIEMPKLGGKRSRRRRRSVRR